MKALEIAQDIAYLCNKYNYPFNNTKIQKLLYLFVGFCLINNVSEIYTIDEKPKIWPYGPVFPRVHKKYSEIKQEIEQSKQNAIKSVSNEQIKNILEQTVKQWGDIPAAFLSDWSHIEGSPWYVLAIQQGAKWNTAIDLDNIKTYFKNNVENIIE
jgi:uncharacterized phage-associated protein